MDNLIKLLKIGILGIIFLFLLSLFFNNSKDGKSLNDKNNSLKEIVEEDNSHKKITALEAIEVVKHNATINELMECIEVHVVVRNLSEENIYQAHLQSRFEDKAGNILGTSIGIGQNIPPGGEQTVNILCEGLNGNINKVDSYTIEITEAGYDLVDIAF